MHSYGMTVDGQSLPGTGEDMPVVDPATGETIAQCSSANPAQVDLAVEAAKRAFTSWSAQTDEKRSEACLAIACALESDAEEIARLLTRETGKPLGGLGSRFEVGGAVAWARHTASLSLPVEVVNDGKNGQVELCRKPIGVVGSITPWNWPLLIAVWHILPAIRTGNTIIIKPSPLAPLATLRLVELANEVLPPGVVNAVTGGGEAGARLAGHPDIAKVSLTGSSETGRKVAHSAADRLARVTLELGGNDAGIVLPGTDFSELVEALFWGAFINNGQTCGALKRLYVHADQVEGLSEALARYAEGLVVGSGLDEASQLGPLQNEMQYRRVCDLVERALKDGAKALTGAAPLDRQGYFYAPTILVDCRDEMDVVREEQFGPVLPIVSYVEVEDAIVAANASPFGLGASIWSSDLSRARDLAQRLEAGTVWINQHGTIRPDVPFGGIKCSGMGVMFGELGLREFTSLQVVMR